MKLYVGNLSYSTTEDDLRQLFGAYGTPDSVSVISDRGTGRSKGFGFVEFSKDEEAKAAMAALNGKEIDGRALTVEVAGIQDLTFRRQTFAIRARKREGRHVLEGTFVGGQDPDLPAPHGLRWRQVRGGSIGLRRILFQ